MLNGWMQLRMLSEMCELGLKKHVVLSHCHSARWQGPRYWLVAMDGASSSAWSRTSWRRRSISSSARRFNRLRTRCSNAAITGTWEGQTNQNDHTLQTWPPHHNRWSGNSPELYSWPDKSKKFQSHLQHYECHRAESIHMYQNGSWGLALTPNKSNTGF